MLSGTLNVTLEKMASLKKEAALAALPLVVEPGGPEVVMFEGIDLVFVPSVLNSSEVQWILGKHRAWVLHQTVNWEKVVPEAYIVLNPDSSVGRVTKADCGISREVVAAYAEIAEHYFHFPIVYIEYSGMFGVLDIVKAAAGALESTILYYGGGIDSPEKAAEMAKYADTIVVGNAVYDRGIDVLKATVRAVQ